MTGGAGSTGGPGLGAVAWGGSPFAGHAVHYVLTLYVASLAPRSVAAIRAVTQVCERHVPGCYDLHIIDIYEHPSLARRERIFAAPTLVKTLPGPACQLIGELHDERRLTQGLGFAIARDPPGGA